MANNLIVCEIDPELTEKLKKFNFRKAKNNAALIMKVDMEKQLIVLDEELEDCTLDDVQAELPEHLPRYIAYSYCQKHDDGRVSYPLCFIFCSPAGCKPEQQMMYAGSKLHLVNKSGFTKVFEVRSPEEITEEWLLAKLKFFH